MYIMLVKKENKRWKFIDADVSNKLQNQQLWWELHEKYESELGEDDDEDSVKEAETSNKKKKKKSKKAKKLQQKKEDL